MKMQNKKEKQQQEREEHKKQIAESKARRSGKLNLDRQPPVLEERQTFLIYCEGQNTEPSYFNQFKILTASIKSFGEGRNTVSLVERAKQLADEKEYDQVWCVFDADPKPDNPQQLSNFNEAVRLADSYNFGVAYSNQAFEYWLILHFEDHQGGSMDRTLYNDKINRYINPLGATYDGNGSKIISKNFFELLFEIDETVKSTVPSTRTEIAIKRAKRIYESYNNSNSGREESSTTVFSLVKELIKFM